MKYSIIVPVYNSENTIIDLYKMLDAYFKISYEIIFVNDCSQDKSLQALKSISSVHVRIVDLKENIGQQNALFNGLRYAKGEWIITLDDDLQHNIKYLDRMIDKTEKYDLIYGVPMKQHASPHRHLGSKLTATFFRNRFGKNIRVSSFRIFNGKLLAKVLSCPYQFIYLSAILLEHTDRVYSLDVINEKRKFGKSGYNFKKLMALFLRLNIYYGNLVPEKVKKVRHTDPVKGLYNIDGEINETNFDVRRGQLSTQCHS